MITHTPTTNVVPRASQRRDAVRYQEAFARQLYKSMGHIRLAAIFS
jgi:hypothetical protein